MRCRKSSEFLAVRIQISVKVGHQNLFSLEMDASAFLVGFLSGVLLAVGNKIVQTMRRKFSGRGTKTLARCHSLGSDGRNLETSPSAGEKVEKLYIQTVRRNSGKITESEAAEIKVYGKVLNVFTEGLFAFDKELSKKYPPVKRDKWSRAPWTPVLN